MDNRNIVLKEKEMSIKNLLQKEKSKEEITEDPEWKDMESQSKKITKSPSCPVCGSEMRKINGNFGFFWGCSKYGETKCTGKISIYSKGKNIVKRKVEETSSKIEVENVLRDKEIVSRYICDLLIGQVPVPESLVTSMYEYFRTVFPPLYNYLDDKTEEDGEEGF